MKQRDKLQILLLQIRDEQQVRDEELNSFSQYSQLRRNQFTVLNTFDTPQFSPGIVDSYDALFIGGASEASVLEPDNYPFVEAAIEMVQYSINNGIPVFASCFGFQLAVLALGGTIIRDVKDFEMGSIPISLTSTAKSDLLFHDTPDNFLAVAVHQERAIELPECCELLAFTEQCCHSFTLKDKPFWAFQFHPEVDKAILVERLTVYKAKYTNGNGHLAEVLSSVEETPESNKLLEKFVDRVLIT